MSCIQPRNLNDEGSFSVNAQYDFHISDYRKIKSDFTETKPVPRIFKVYATAIF